MELHSIIIKNNRASLASLWEYASKFAGTDSFIDAHKTSKSWHFIIRPKEQFKKFKSVKVSPWVTLNYGISKK